MHYPDEQTRAKIKLLFLGLVLVVALAGSLLTVRQERRREALLQRAFCAGQAAYAVKDWSTACKHLQECLHQNPDNVEALKKFAHARLRMRPSEPVAIYQAGAAYRQVIELDPHDESSYRELARLYRAIHDFDGLAYIARRHIEHYPDDRESPLWLAEALIFQDKPQAAQTLLEPYIDEVEAQADKHEEYAHAYLLMSRIAGRDEARLQALEWISRAIDYAPKSVEALVQRAQFYIDNPKLSEMDQTQTLDRARQDLEAADALGTNNPQLRFSLGKIWMSLDEFDRAEAELQAAARLGPDDLEAHYLDLKDWHISRYFFASELALRRGDPSEAASLADETLDQLDRAGHRMRVLPSIINAYVAAGRIPDARQRLDEYEEAVHRHHGTRLLGATLAQAQNQVAQAEATL